jgi:uncharacterized phage-like protein YoqJ
VGEEKYLIETIKQSLLKIAEKDPRWRLYLGKEKLSAAEVLKRLDKDKELRKLVTKNSIALAIEMWNEGSKRFGQAQSDSG